VDRSTDDQGIEGSRGRGIEPSIPRSVSGSPLAAGTSLIVGLVTLKLVIHLVAAGITPYEFHRDELLYFSMGTHLRLFHMDFPPMIALLSELLRHTVGISVLTYRVFPALVGTALFALALLCVHRLGGGRIALLLTGIAMLSGPLFLRTSSLFQPVVLDQLWWTAALYALLRLEQTDDPRWWWALGLAGGLGLLTKFSIFFIGFGVLVALLLTRRRRALLGPGPWIALVIALVVGSPSLIGQVTLDWPVFDQMEGLRRGQLDRMTWGEYLGTQVMMIGPALLLAIAGAVALIARRPLAQYRVVGIACVVTFLLLGVLHGKPYYAGPVYPMLFAAGAVWVERIARARLRAAVAWGIGLASAAFGIAVAPFGLPVVPPEPMAQYATAVGITAATQTNWGTQLALPQDYADMLGWREKADAVAMVVGSLPSDERERAVLYGGNYGHAGLLDLYGRRLGLPPVVSLAGSFYLFGPGERPGEVIVFLGVEPEDLRDLQCRSLVMPARVTHPWTVPGEDDVPVVVCRGPGMTLQEVWRREGPGWG
jgi:4-amino-4-deoxy-L-arabinose transferase-like glycosyltransferase